MKDTVMKKITQARINAMEQKLEVVRQALICHLIEHHWNELNPPGTEKNGYWLLSYNLMDNAEYNRFLKEIE